MCWAGKNEWFYLEVCLFLVVPWLGNYYTTYYNYLTNKVL